MPANDSSLALQHALLLDRALSAQTDALVRRAAKTTLLLRTSVDMEVSQLTNLLSTAADSKSVEMVCLFILYQMARSPGAWGRSKSDFGHQVIDDLRGTVDKAAKSAIEVVKKNAQLTDAEAGELQKSAYYKLMMLYLGYIYRAFYASKRLESFAPVEEVFRA